MIRNTNIFNEEIKSTFLLHIPHSSFYIPDESKFRVDLSEELLLSTDVATDIIFDVEGVNKHLCHFSRLFCDVERFIVDEKMDKFGRGFYYTKTNDGKELRSFSEKDRSYILENYYNPYHKEVTSIVDEILNKNNIVHIIDCHSFNDKKFSFEREGLRPDICLGVDEYHTPKYLVDYLKNIFESYNFKVEINFPHSEAFVPLKYYHLDNRIKSIMIEINKKLYMNDDKIINSGKLHKLNEIINDIFVF